MDSGNPYISVNRATRKAITTPILRQSALPVGARKLVMKNQEKADVETGHDPHAVVVRIVHGAVLLKLNTDSVKAWHEREALVERLHKTFSFRQYMALITSACRCARANAEVLVSWRHRQSIPWVRGHGVEIRPQQRFSLLHGRVLDSQTSFGKWPA